MSWGFDTATNTDSEVSCLKTAKINHNPVYFVCRYYNTNDSSKNLTLTEAKDLSTAGFFIVAVWENGYPTSQSYFTYSQGVSDSKAAFNYAANTIGQPSTTPVYFAIDYDAYTSSDKTAILNHFSGVEEGYQEYLRTQHNLGLPTNEYYIGVYGGYDVLSWCKTQGIAQFFWQTGSTGWYNNSAECPGVNIWKKGPSTVCQLSVDLDEGISDPGG